MKLEAGKYYKTRNGLKAYVIGMLPPEISDDCYVSGIIFDGICHRYENWYKGGFFMPNLDMKQQQLHESDLVLEWVEPKSKAARDAELILSLVSDELGGLRLDQRVKIIELKPVIENIISQHGASNAQP